MKIINLIWISFNNFFAPLQDHNLRTKLKKDLYDRIFWLLESSTSITYNEILEMSYPMFTDIIKSKSDLEDLKKRKLEEHVKSQIEEHRKNEAKQKQENRAKERINKEHKYRYKK